MRLILFGVFVTCALLWGGSQGIYEAVSFRQPKVVTYEQFIQQKPKAGWFHIRGCFLDVLGATWVQSRGTKQIKEVYLPVHSVNGRRGAQVQLLMATKDPRVVQTVTESRQVDQSRDPRAAATFLARNRDRLWVRRGIEGMVRFGIDANSRTRDKITGVNHNLAADYLILEEGQKPKTIGFSAVMLCLGLALPVFGVVQFARRKA